MNLPRAAWALARDFTGFAGWRRSTLAAALMTAGALAEGLSLALIVPLVALIGNPAGPRWQPVLGQMCARAGLCERSAVLTGLLALFILAFALRAVLLAREVDVESEAIALSMLGKGERRGTACRFVVGVGRGTFAQGLQPDGRA